MVGERRHGDSGPIRKVSDDPLPADARPPNYRKPPKPPNFFAFLYWTERRGFVEKGLLPLDPDPAEERLPDGFLLFFRLADDQINQSGGGRSMYHHRFRSRRQFRIRIVAPFTARPPSVAGVHLPWAPASVAGPSHHSPTGLTVKYPVAEISPSSSTAPSEFNTAIGFAALPGQHNW